jgi:DNA-binding CsgD family transcriptional regulator
MGRLLAPPASLVGRNAEREMVERLIADVRGGRSRGLVLRGDPGVGKTALLEFACREAADLRVLSASATPSESDLPFAGLHALVRPLLPLLAKLPPGQASVLQAALALAPGEPVDRFATYAATLNLLVAAAAEKPLLICVDDGHWLDLPSAEALSFTARRLEVDPVGLLVTERPTGRAVLDIRSVPVLEVAGLDAEAAGQLLREAGVPAAAPVVAKLTQETAGNPLALCEVAAQLSPAQRAGAEPIPEPLPAGAAAEALFADRIRTLDPTDRAGLLLVAAEPSADLDVLRTAAARLGLRRDLLESAENENLIRLDGNRLVFRHPLVRSAVFALSSEAERRRAHRAIADALVDPADADRRAWHLAYAATGRDEDAASALEAAAHNARRRSGYAAASAALAHAARLSGDQPRRARRLLGAADNARMAGQTNVAAGYLRVALDMTSDPRLSAELYQTLGRLYLFDGRVREAATLLARSAAALDEQARGAQGSDAADLGLSATSLYAESSFASLVAGQVRESFEAASLAHARQPVAGSPAELITQLALGTGLFHLSPSADSFRMFMAAAGTAETSVPRVDPEYAVFAGLALLWAGQVSRAESLLREVEDETRRSVALGVLPCVLYGLAYVYSRTGRLVAAAGVASEGVQVAEETGQHLWRYFNGGCLAYVAAVRGKEAECGAHVDYVTDVARRLDIEYPATIADSLGLLALGRGRYEEAITHLEPVNRSGIRELGDISLGRPTAMDLVEAYIRAGRPLAANVVDQLDMLGAQEDFPAQAALAFRCRGLMAADDDVDELFRTAYAFHDRVPNPWARARTALCYGERLRRAGRRGEARQQLRAAFDAFTRADAGVWADRARDELRAAGERVQASPAPLAGQLTPQELQIALAVATGASNREVAAKLFLSEKTVEFHLSRIYRKAGVRSRTELTRQMLSAGS